MGCYLEIVAVCKFYSMICRDIYDQCWVRVDVCRIAEWPSLGSGSRDQWRICLKLPGTTSDSRTGVF